MSGEIFMRQGVTGASKKKYICHDKECRAKHPTFRYKNTREWSKQDQSIGTEKN